MPKIFYGWWIVIASLIISALTSGICQYGFTAFFQPIHNEFGWTYTQISIAASLRGLETGLLSPVAGVFVDRIGPRRLMLIGTIALGLGLIFFSYVGSLIMFYGVFAFMLIGFGICIGTVPMSALANWFQKKISIAIGIMTCGVGLSGLLIILIVNLIESYGWRLTALILGISVIIIAVPLSLLFRHKPEKYGYLPDGNMNNVIISQNTNKIKSNDINVPYRKALMSSTFWHITVAMTLHLLVVGGLITHVMPYLSSIAIPRYTSGLVAGSIPLISIIGRLGTGWFGDKINKKWVSATNFASMGMGLLFFSFISTERILLLIPFLVLFGIGFGGNFALSGALTRDYFGREHFGKINGFMYGIMTLGSMFGPLSAGYVFDIRGNYQFVWLIFAVVAIAALCIIITTPKMEADYRATV